jgi:hypothetical protein
MFCCATGLNSEAHTCKAGTLQLDIQSFLAVVIFCKGAPFCLRPVAILLSMTFHVTETTDVTRLDFLIEMLYH